MNFKLVIPFLIIVCMIAAFQFTRHQTSEVFLTQINSLNVDDVSKITIQYGEYKNDNKIVKAVDDSSLIAEFIAGIKTTEDYSPNHPNYNFSHLIDVKIKNGVNLQFLFHDQEGSEYVYIDLVSSSKRSIRHYKSMKSKALQEWFRKAMPNLKR